MPVEIKELVIRAVAVPEQGSGPGSGKGGAAGKTAASAPLDQEAIVEAAVREVMRILKASRER